MNIRHSVLLKGLSFLTLLLAISSFLFFHVPKTHAFVAMPLTVQVAPYKCLDADANNLNNGGKVQLWSCWGGANQNWNWDYGHCKRFSDGVSYCELRNGQNSNLCLDADANNLNNGGKVQLWSCWGGDNQLWGDYTNSSGSETIYLYAGNNLSLDANAGCDTSDGCNIQVWTSNGGTNQHWAWD